MKNIAILIPTIENGGMERVASQLSTIISEDGNRVFLFVMTYNRRKAYQKSGRIVKCFINIDISNSVREATSYLLASIIIKDYLQKYNIDITISFGQEMNLLNIFANIGDRKILTVHNCMSLREDLTGITNKRPWVFLWNYSWRIVAVCKWVKNDLVRNYGINKDRVTVIYNPVMGEIKKRKEIRNRKEYILTVGRIEDIKAQWHLIKAMYYVVMKRPDVYLVIAGEGPNKQKLQMLIDKLGLENNIKFLGFIKDIGNYYESARILVLSSASEAFPCTAIEALSYGTPIIASDFPRWDKGMYGI